MEEIKEVDKILEEITHIPQNTERILACSNVLKECLVSQEYGLICKRNYLDIEH